MGIEDATRILFQANHSSTLQECMWLGRPDVDAFPQTEQDAMGNAIEQYDEAGVSPWDAYTTYSVNLQSMQWELYSKKRTKLPIPSPRIPARHQVVCHESPRLFDQH